MTIVNIIILLLTSALHVNASIACNLERPSAVRQGSKSKQSKTVWRPARYHGLTIGKSTEADMLRALGKPKWSETFTENGSKAEVWHHYESKDIPGELVVNVDKKSKVILRLVVHPNHFSKDEAIKYFGDHYVTTRYEFCPGFQDEESAPLYETPTGQFSYVEYRNKGITISLDAHGKVAYVTYVSEPIGVSSRCTRP